MCGPCAVKHCVHFQPPRCEPCTHPTSVSCFPSLAHLPAPLPLLAQGLQCPHQTFSLYSVAHRFQGALGERLEAAAVWWSHPHCSRDAQGGEQTSSVPREFPRVQLSARCAFSFSNRFLGRRTSSLLLAFHSHAEC